MRSSGVMPPSPVVVDVPHCVAAVPSASLTLAESAPKLIPATVIGISISIGRLANRVPSTVLVDALLAIALERIPRDRRGQKDQIVEGRDAAFGAQAADVVKARLGRLMNVGEHVAVEAGAFFQTT